MNLNPLRRPQPDDEPVPVSTLGAPTVRVDDNTVPWFRAQREFTRPGNQTTEKES